jgi:hypothetical protein
MSNYDYAFEMSPVPALSPGAVAASDLAAV